MSDENLFLAGAASSPRLRGRVRVLVSRRLWPYVREAIRVSLPGRLRRKLVRVFFSYSCDGVYAENTYYPGEDVFEIAFSDRTPEEIVFHVAVVELTKATLFFMNPAVRAFRISIPKQKGGPLYELLADTVENSAVAAYSPLAYLAFEKIFSHEKSGDIWDDMVYMSPLWTRGELVSPRTAPELLSVLLASYGEELVVSARAKTGFEIAEELAMLSRVIGK